MYMYIYVYAYLPYPTPPQPTPAHPSPRHPSPPQPTPPQPTPAHATPPHSTPPHPTHLFMYLFIYLSISLSLFPAPVTTYTLPCPPSVRMQGGISTLQGMRPRQVGACHCSHSRALHCFLHPEHRTLQEWPADLERAGDPQIYYKGSPHSWNQLGGVHAEPCGLQVFRKYDLVEPKEAAPNGREYPFCSPQMDADTQSRWKAQLYEIYRYYDGDQSYSLDVRESLCLAPLSGWLLFCWTSLGIIAAQLHSARLLDTRSPPVLTLHGRQADAVAKSSVLSGSIPFCQWIAVLRCGRCIWILPTAQSSLSCERAEF